MNRLVNLALLTDWYGSLLTERQRTYVRQYAYEDCSLAEIAEREGVSRQAVRESIAAAETEMLRYEAALGMIRKNEQARRLLERLSNLSETSEEQRALIQSLFNLLEEDDGV